MADTHSSPEEQAAAEAAMARGTALLNERLGNGEEVELLNAPLDEDECAVLIYNWLAVADRLGLAGPALMLALSGADDDERVRLQVALSDLVNFIFYTGLVAEHRAFHAALAVTDKESVNG